MQQLTILYLHKKVIFPHCSLLAPVRGRRHENLQSGDRVLAVPFRNFLDLVMKRNIIATLAEVEELEKKKSLLAISLKGIARARLRKRVGFGAAEYEIIEETETGVMEATIDDLRKKSQELIFLINVSESDKLIHLLNFITNIHQLTDFVANYFVVNFSKRYRLHGEAQVGVRARLLIFILDDLIKKFREKQNTKKHEKKD
jgi:ATP-dependent Lon protease